MREFTVSRQRCSKPRGQIRRTLLNLAFFVSLAVVLGGCSTGYSAFNDISSNNPLEALRKIEDGASVDGVSFQDNTTLHWAARHGQLSVIEKLLELGLPVDSENGFGTTPLMYAVGFGHMEAAQLLISKGADVKKQNKAGYTVTSLAVLLGDSKNLEYLLAKGAPLDADLVTGGTPLLMALANSRPQLAKILLDAGADPSAPTSSGDTALHWAVATENVDLMQRLLATGSDIDAQSTVGVTPLHVSAALNHSRISALLLESGALVKTDNLGRSALHYVAATSDVELAKDLVAAGADVDSQDFFGWSPILIAANSGSEALLDLFLGENAEPTPRLSSGSLSLASARALARRDKLFSDRNTDGESERVKQYFLLAREQFQDRADSERSKAKGLAFARSFARAATQAAWDSMLAIQQEARQRNMNEILALSFASESGGGYPAYQQALASLNASPQISVGGMRQNVVETTASEPDIDIAMYESRAVEAEKHVHIVEQALLDAGVSQEDWGLKIEAQNAPDISESGDLRRTEQDEYCTALAPRSLRSVTGSYSLLSRKYLFPEDEIEQGVMPVNFLWEVSQPVVPATPREAGCAMEIFVEQCRIAMRWSDSMGFLAAAGC